MDTHFVDCTTGRDDNTPDEYTEHFKPKDWNLAGKIVQPDKVRWAIKTFEPFVSPGLDGIRPVMLQEGGEVLLGTITMY